MAYMSQEKKKALAPGVKAVLKKYGMKGSLSVRHHMTLVLTLSEGELDLPEYANFNLYWLEKNHEGKVLDFLKEVKAALNVGNHDRSDIMTDYFDVGWYVDVKAGGSKPYRCTAVA